VSNFGRQRRGNISRYSAQSPLSSSSCNYNSLSCKSESFRFPAHLGNSRRSLGNMSILSPLAFAPVYNMPLIAWQHLSIPIDLQASTHLHVFLFAQRSRLLLLHRPLLISTSNLGVFCTTFLFRHYDDELPQKVSLNKDQQLRWLHLVVIAAMDVLDP
jgi:hypothetical protein